MQIHLFEGHAFTNTNDQPLGQAPRGNPALVLYTQQCMDPHEQSTIARIARSPMTTFVSPCTGRQGYDLRTFAPKGNEIDFCGHATFVATCFLKVFIDNVNIYHYHLNSDFAAGEHVVQVSAWEHGLAVRCRAYGAHTKNFGKNLQKIATALNVKVGDISRVLKSDLNDVIIVLNRSDALRQAKPHYEGLIDLANEGLLSHRTLSMTAISGEDGYDYEARVFLPCIGVNEDVACGSINCSLAPFWHNVTGKEKLKMFYVSPQGGGRLSVGGVQEIELHGQELTIRSNVRPSWYEVVECDGVIALSQDPVVLGVLAKAQKAAMVEGLIGSFAGARRSA